MNTDAERKKQGAHLNTTETVGGTTMTITTAAIVIAKTAKIGTTGVAIVMTVTGSATGSVG